MSPRSREANARSRERHGRAQRSLIAGPELPPLWTRFDAFDSAVAGCAEYLKELWPDELAAVTFEVAGIPAQIASARGVDRWRVYPDENRVLLYRLPIERLSRLHKQDALHRRLMIESCVFRAVAELLGKDPWDLAPDRFRHL
ncbi:metallopeptidase family protein [Galbitalea sp. SE-J8]|uniref:metallopeptidase family protein n=1 Tax=Galbitalea sp. SE-J8 TaxID=3054952 RepID=UPI00259CD23C|nr:metallopeptidase family protein [Galbitalea sp. SE-J8]MDM4762714.1 metallopeptidase family protein [Galbitalea sp. SE-J8]